MSDGGSPPALVAAAERFARSLTERIQRVFDTDAEFDALLMNGDRVGVGRLGALDGEGEVFKPIPLTINGQHMIDLTIKYHLCWDREGSFLATDMAWVIARPAAKRSEPLLRYEYVRKAANGVPVSHLQVHAHRDEFTYLMLYADKERPREHRRKDSVAKLSAFHFPLGGHRFRPCMEDVLQALIVEFGVDATGNWRTALSEGRETWRRIQTKAAIRDAPSLAATELQRMGYDVQWRGEEPPPADRLDRIRAY